MTKLVRSLLLAAAPMLFGGCVVAHHPFPGGYSRHALSHHDCPPGHQWSDGSCHSQGKGHDRHKHGGKHH